MKELLSLVVYLVGLGIVIHVVSRWSDRDDDWF